MIEIDCKFPCGQVHHHWTTCHSKQNIRIYLNLNIDPRIDMCVELSFGRLMACTRLMTMQQPLDLEANDCEVKGKDLLC
jgi:hypothetical protein